MTLASVMALFGAMIVFALIPGPGVFAVIARSLSLGIHHGLAVLLGVVTGDVLFITLCVFGLTALAENMGWLFIVIKYVGAIYLLYLAITIWRSPVNEEALETVNGSGYLKDYSVGLFTTLSNPKAILFYVGFLPAFIDFTAINAFDVFVLMVMTALTFGGVLFGYAVVAARTRVLLAKPSARRLLNRAAGSIMGITGIWMVSRN